MKLHFKFLRLNKVWEKNSIQKAQLEIVPHRRKNLILLKKIFMKSLVMNLKVTIIEFLVKQSKILKNPKKNTLP